MTRAEEEKKIVLAFAYECAEIAVYAVTLSSKEKELRLVEAYENFLGKLTNSKIKCKEDKKFIVEKAVSCNGDLKENLKIIEEFMKD